MSQFYSHGKLLITGEYLVLDGAKALAVPTVFGQDLSVKKMIPTKYIGKVLIIWERFGSKLNSMLTYFPVKKIKNLPTLN